MCAAAEELRSARSPPVHKVPVRRAQIARPITPAGTGTEARAIGAYSETLHRDLRGHAVASTCVDQPALEGSRHVASTTRFR